MEYIVANRRASMTLTPPSEAFELDKWPRWYRITSLQGKDSVLVLFYD